MIPAVPVTLPHTHARSASPASPHWDIKRPPLSCCSKTSVYQTWRLALAFSVGVSPDVWDTPHTPHHRKQPRTPRFHLLITQGGLRICQRCHRLAPADDVDGWGSDKDGKIKELPSSTEERARWQPPLFCAHKTWNGCQGRYTSHQFLTQLGLSGGDGSASEWKKDTSAELHRLCNRK